MSECLRICVYNCAVILFIITRFFVFNIMKNVSLCAHVCTCLLARFVSHVSPRYLIKYVESEIEMVLMLRCLCVNDACVDGSTKRVNIIKLRINI